MKKVALGFGALILAAFAPAAHASRTSRFAVVNRPPAAVSSVEALQRHFAGGAVQRLRLGSTDLVGITVDPGSGTYLPHGFLYRRSGMGWRLVRSYAPYRVAGEHGRVRTLVSYSFKPEGTTAIRVIAEEYTRRALHGRLVDRVTEASLTARTDLP
jgi:hypothetical protein